MSCLDLRDVQQIPDQADQPLYLALRDVTSFLHRLGGGRGLLPAQALDGELKRGERGVKLM